LLFKKKILEVTALKLTLLQSLVLVFLIFLEALRLGESLAKQICNILEISRIFLEFSSFPF